ncbi:cellulose biosynthesis protein BcsO [Erwinia billingiae]|uniref:cellulose biosynthesis protein BcsO n=1 Tax=Erwinia billingiae TaxID=182337 RepID=UPI00224539D6|nr:cellulose biosynthesis protein BcsO [Erwinia billingiae]MCX0498532.1 cellulose biosynthesis protein BcsO [Erwinia billingiae]
MKSYDDLQRFKEKTQTNHIEFKDMSEQTKNSDGANWAIIKQLMNDGAESALGNGQRIDVPAPQPIAEDSLDALLGQAAQPLQPPVQQPKPQHQPPTNAPSHSVAPLVAKPAAAQIGGSLLDSISASLKPAPVAEPAPKPQAVNPFNESQNPLASAQPAFAAPVAAPAAQPAPAASPLMASLSSLPTAAPAQTAPVRQPAAPVQPAADLPRFKQLFSTAPEPSVTSLSKDTLLQPLLERIASCR